MQAQRLADLGCAEVRKKMYAEEIPWKEIVKSAETKVPVLTDVAALNFPQLGARKFQRTCTLKSVKKITEDGKEWYLATLDVKIESMLKKDTPFRSVSKKAKIKNQPIGHRIYTYKILLYKSTNLTPTTG